MMDIEELKKDLLELLVDLERDLERDLDEIDLNRVRYFIGYNELKLAVEFLCEYIYEDEILLNGQTIERVNGFCKILNVDKAYWLNSSS